MPLTISSNVSGSGTFIVQNPASASNRTLTLPDATTTLVGTDTTQTLTNKILQGGALTLGTAQASTSGTSIDFTGIPSWAKRITVMLNGVSLSGTSYPLIQAGTSSGPVTTGYTGVIANTSGNGGLVTSGLQVMTITTASSTLVTTGVVSMVNQSGNTWAMTSVSGRVDGGSQAAISVSSVTLSGALDRIRVTTVNGTDTFDAGTINIMWEG